ncbi:MAG TPA: FG-GAP-like repeat-containing protein, partial [Vicinamibacterales bacterium]|nr:FG-GAP-like repeat-containing protein [Vicinamibacterales bacterium]
MWPSRFLPAPVASLSAALIFCVLTAASIASAEQTPGGPGHAGEPLVLAGSGAGAGLTRAVNAVDGTAIFSSQQFGAGFTGGVRVAVGDVNGDGIQDLIVGSGPGGGLVRVFSGLDHSMLMSFAPFGGGFSGGVYVASADIDGDGRADVIVGAGSGGRIAVFSGVDAHELERALPFTETYRGGVTVAAGDVDGDGHADLVVGTTIAGFVTALSGVDGHVITAGFPFGLFFVGGVSVAVGDLDRDGRGDIIVAQMSRGGRVLAYSGATLDVLASFVPYPGTNGVNLAAADVDGDGRADIITGPASGAPLVKIFSGADQHQMNAFLAFDSRLRGGVFVASNSEFVVPGAPTFTSAATAPWTVGSSDVFSITTSGSPTATITLSGALPAGLSFNGGSGRASISGTPTSAGSTTVNLTATNGLGVATQALTLAVEGAASSGDNKASGNSATATFTSAAAATFGVGAPGSFTVTTVANLDVTSILETGTLPTGVSFVDNGNGTATLSGTPAAGTHGVYPITFTASNGHKTAIQNFTLTVSPPSGGAPTITSANGVTFVVKARGSFTITTTGTAPVTITATGTMPSGVTLKSNGDGTATFAGTPAPSSAGTYPLTISASNGLGTATQAFTLTVTHANATPQFTSAA